MASGYGHSYVYEPQPRKKIFNRVTPQVKRPVGRPRKFHVLDEGHNNGRG